MLVKLGLGYRTVKKRWRYVKPLSSDTGTLRTEGQTDRFAISISRLSMLTRDKNAALSELWMLKKSKKSRCKFIHQVAAQVHASNKVLSVQAFARRTAVLTCRFYLKFAFPYSWCFSTPFKKCSTGQEPSVPTGNSIHLWCIRVTTDQPTNNQPTTWATLCVMHAKSKFTDDRSTLRCGFNAGPTIALSWTAACIPAVNTSSLADTCTSHQIISSTTCG